MFVQLVLEIRYLISNNFKICLDEIIKKYELKGESISIDIT